MSRVLRVLVTRAAADAEALAAPLRAVGVEVVCVPLLERQLCVEAVASALDGQDLAVLTSATAARTLAAAIEAGGLPPGSVACVGPATARAAAPLGLPQRPLPEAFTALDLVAELGDLAGTRVIYPHAERPTPGVRDALVASGARLTAVVAYRNELPPTAAAALDGIGPVDVVTLMSASAARRLGRIAPVESPVREARIVVIGPTTAGAAIAAGLGVWAVATPHNVEGIVSVVREYAKECSNPAEGGG